MDINTLNSFLGYGDFREADMLVLSKHEGANNELLEQELDARINHFGIEKDFWLDKRDRLNGYWHPSAKEAGDIKKSLMISDGLDEEKEDGVPFVVNFPSRILLALEEAFDTGNNGNIDQWFNPLGEDPYSEKLKKTFVEIYSYDQSTRWKAALSHYQPLPKKNGTYPYTKLFPKKEYENVFGVGEQPENKSIAELRNRREEILASLLKKYPKKLIFCTGNYTGYYDSLYYFFEKRFNASLRPFKINNRFKGFYGVFTYDGHRTVVFHTQGFANGGGLSRKAVGFITKSIYRSFENS